MLDCLYVPRNTHISRDELASRVSAQRALLDKTLPSLIREGHTILATGVGPAQPFVYLAPSPRLNAMCKEGKAAWCARGVDEDGQRWRKGQLLAYRNVLVTWTERGH